MSPRANYISYLIFAYIKLHANPLSILALDLSDVLDDTLKIPQFECVARNAATYLNL
jgi:hypothetical protein